MRYCTSPGWSSGEDFLAYLINTFNCLYREGQYAPKMMTVGLHPRLSGRPGRTEIIKKFLDYLSGYSKVWVTTRAQISEHWYRNFLPDIVLA